MDRLPVIFIYRKSLLKLSAHRQGFLQSQAINDVLYGLLESWKHLSHSNQQEAFKYTVANCKSWRKAIEYFCEV